MSLRCLSLLLLVLIVGRIGAAQAQPALPTAEAPAPQAPYKTAVEQSRVLLDTLMEREHIPGLTAAFEVGVAEALGPHDLAVD